ncbi:hypothetical protein AWH56_020565 [Anaerobacillus isosaccharinicus]|uniref:Uncharacterized protein n=1 Tax=Anaerobacillus isosaccharinicus TaxID=1532552 RepID=A0A1S2MD00_9BACI|nr:hypothetical protein [Anaerobacillus isosaccharinicus]MBA5586700.1 hypothetical protein [Anaerobacillus isosaccharinicus]QOY35073.1 hypothetical protein AWH56_020565 [Anaerobacillus isosaccharinicus]
MKQYMLVIVMAMILVGCQSAQVSFPFDKIDPDFGLAPFEIPEEWDVLSIGYQQKLENEHETDPHKQIFIDEPQMVQFMFGKASEINEYDMEKLKMFEESRGNRGSKTIYQASRDQLFAEIWINTEDPEVLERKLENIHHTNKNSSIFEYGEVIEVNGKNIYYTGREGSPPEKYYWASNDNKLMFFLWFYESDLSEEERQVKNMISILEKLTKEQ